MLMRSERRHSIFRLTAFAVALLTLMSASAFAQAPPDGTPMPVRG